MTGNLDVSGLAHAYRRLVLWFGAQLIAGLLQTVAGERSTIEAVAVLATITTIVALVIYGYRTATALGSESGWVWGVSMLVPCINVITLLILSSKATRACRANGIPVGFFGPEVPAGGEG